MAKIIIYLNGRVLVHGHKIRDFRWSDAHKKFLYRSKEFTLEEFNDAYEDALRTNGDLNPKVMVLLAPAVTAPIAPPPVVVPASVAKPAPKKNKLVEVDA